MTEIRPETVQPDIIRVRVYWEDTDAAGIVYYANYLKFMERGRTEWLRRRGIDQRPLLERDGFGFAVREVALDYQAPARLEDMLTVSTVISAHGGAWVTFDQMVSRGDLLLVRGTIKCVALSPATGQPRRLPRELLALVRPATAPR